MKEGFNDQEHPKKISIVRKIEYCPDVLRATNGAHVAAY